MGLYVTNAQKEVLLINQVFVSFKMLIVKAITQHQDNAKNAIQDTPSKITFANYSRLKM